MSYKIAVNKMRLVILFIVYVACAIVTALTLMHDYTISLLLVWFLAYVPGVFFQIITLGMFGDRFFEVSAFGASPQVSMSWVFVAVFWAAVVVISSFPIEKADKNSAE